MEQGKVWLREWPLLARRRPLTAVHGEYPLLGPGLAEVPNAHTPISDTRCYCRAETAKEQRTIN